MTAAGLGRVLATFAKVALDRQLVQLIDDATCVSLRERSKLEDLQIGSYNRKDTNVSDADELAKAVSRSVLRHWRVVSMTSLVSRSV